ncbi:hypothetical protein HDV02_005244 [Globomyces sp. JEL0801]|nr:hypothetical protein HDV02_005244 [Globomyces sp. JEL0801]
MRFYSLGPTIAKNPLKNLNSPQSVMSVYDACKVGKPDDLYCLAKYFNITGETPLHYAAAAGNLACVKILTEAGAELEKHSRTGLTPLEIAIAAPGSGRLDVIEFLISAGARLGSHIGGNPPLTVAVLTKRLDVVKLLVEAGADIDAKNHENYTAVHVAAIKGFVDIIQYLVSEGCELQTTNVHGQGPLYNAKTVTIRTYLAEQAMVNELRNRSCQFMLLFCRILVPELERIVDPVPTPFKTTPAVPMSQLRLRSNRLNNNSTSENPFAVPVNAARPSPFSKNTNRPSSYPGLGITSPFQSKTHSNNFSALDQIDSPSARQHSPRLQLNVPDDLEPEYSLFESKNELRQDQPTSSSLLSTSSEKNVSTGYRANHMPVTPSPLGQIYSQSEVREEVRKSNIPVKARVLAIESMSGADFSSKSKIHDDIENAHRERPTMNDVSMTGNEGPEKRKADVEETVRPKDGKNFLSSKDHGKRVRLEEIDVEAIKQRRKEYYAKLGMDVPGTASVTPRFRRSFTPQRPKPILRQRDTDGNSPWAGRLSLAGTTAIKSDGRMPLWESMDDKELEKIVLDQMNGKSDKNETEKAPTAKDFVFTAPKPLATVSPSLKEISKTVTFNLPDSSSGLSQTPTPNFSFKPETDKEKPPLFSAGFGKAKESSDSTVDIKQASPAKPFSFTIPNATGSTATKESPATLSSDKSQATVVDFFKPKANTVENTETNTISKSDSKPAFSFGSTDSNTQKTDNKPTFSFGSTAADSSKNADAKAPISFGATAGQVQTNTFSFGNSTTATDSKPETVGNNTIGTTASLSFSKPASTSIEPSFKKPDTPKGLAFGAGAVATDGKDLNNKDTDSTKGFTFGANPVSSTGSVSTNFQFGSASKPETQSVDAKETPSSGFKFGTLSNTATPTSAPVTNTAAPSFSFGSGLATSTGGTKDTNASSGTGGNATGGFNFGQPNQTPAAPFGQASSAPSSNGQQPFSFGAPSSTPTTNAQPLAATSSIAPAVSSTATPFSSVPAFGASTTPAPAPTATASQPSSTNGIQSTSFTFGQPTQPAFGQPGTTAPSTTPSTTTGFSFGSTATPSQPTAAFGQQPAQSQQPAAGAFGQPPQTNTFGQPSQASSFGQQPQSFAFGQSTQPPAFGQSAPASTGAFGQPSQPTGFGQPTPSTNAQPTQANAFGQSSQTGFGQSTQPPPFGQTPQTNAFGQTSQAPATAQPSQGFSFGQPSQPPAFGQSSQPNTFGQSSQPGTFGQTPQSNAFAQPAPPAFGSSGSSFNFSAGPTAPTFNAPTPPAFNAGAAPQIRPPAGRAIITPKSRRGGPQRR